MSLSRRAPATGDPLARLPSPALVLTSISSVQIGAALATTLFARTGASGTVLLRLIFASLVLLVIWRPRIRGLSAQQLTLVGVFGFVLGAMNLTFYESIARIPLGIAVSIEFLGPLGVSIAASRRKRDLVWAALAAAGVLALTNGGGHRHLNVFGVILALLAAVTWAAYILINARMGRSFSSASGLALSMCLATVLVAPAGLIRAGSSLWTGHALALGAAVGVLSSAIPYTLEMEALRRLSPALFGVLMSLEPGVAAVAGWAIAGQSLSGRAVAGIAMVAAASAGAAWAARAPHAAPPTVD